MEQDRIILIVGKSGTGKDYIARALGLKMVVSITTRPIRPNEEDGVHHKFLTPEEYGKLLVDDIVAMTEFDGHSYCATKKCLEGKEAYIVDPAGIYYYRDIREFIRDLPEPVIVYFSSPWYKRLYRMVKRQGWRSIGMAIQRIRHDRVIFKKEQFTFPYTEIRT